MYSSERVDDKISKETSEDLSIGLFIVEQVVRFQFKTANEATHKSTTIELSDLGVFKATKSKLKRKINTTDKKLYSKKRLLDNETLSEKRKDTLVKICNGVEDNLNYLKGKFKSYED